MDRRLAIEGDSSQRSKVQHDGMLTRQKFFENKLFGRENSRFFPLVGDNINGDARLL